MELEDRNRKLREVEVDKTDDKDIELSSGHDCRNQCLAGVHARCTVKTTEGHKNVLLIGKQGAYSQLTVLESIV